MKKHQTSPKRLEKTSRTLGVHPFFEASPHLPVDQPPLPAWSVAPGCGSIAYTK